MRIYLAASLFTPFERERNLYMARELEAIPGTAVFLPQRIRDSRGQRPDAASIFAECVRGVDEADVVVALADGADVDSGVAWELGYAYARDAPIVVVRSDYRAAEAGVVNIMIERCAARLVVERTPSTEVGTVVRALRAAIEALDQEATRGAQ
jgi:nucleoside 2-deoxyribosyltransferase